jgi:hypothetical protein
MDVGNVNFAILGKKQQNIHTLCVLVFWKSYKTLNILDFMTLSLYQNNAGYDSFIKAVREKISTSNRILPVPSQLSGRPQRVDVKVS